MLASMDVSEIREPVMVRGVDGSVTVTMDWPLEIEVTDRFLAEADSERVSFGDGLLTLRVLYGYATYTMVGYNKKGHRWYCRLLNAEQRNGEVVE